MEKESDLQKKKIDTAIKFLQNPRVRQTPMKQRRAFLEKKGLTKEEIDQAISLSGTAADENNVPSSAVVPSQQPSGPPPPPPLPPTVPWRGYFGAAVIGGGLGYLLVNLIKTYIMPLIFNMKQKEEKLEKLETAVAHTNASVTDAVGSLHTSLQSVQEILVEQKKMIKNLSSDLAQTQDKLVGLPTDSYSVGDLKAEIVSLKGLLLNRKQFPPAVVGSPQSPGIPAWQRTAAPSSKTLSFGKGTKVGEDAQGEEATGERSTLDDHSHLNGHSNESSTNKDQVASPLSTSSSSDACSLNTVKSNVSHMDNSMNNALIVEEGDISTDTTLSSLSDMSASASFNEASIAFSSTCIKIPSDVTSGVDESATADTQEVD